MLRWILIPGGIVSDVCRLNNLLQLVRIKTKNWIPNVISVKLILKHILNYPNDCLGGVHTRSEIAKRSEQIPEKQYVRSSSLLL